MLLVLLMLLFLGPRGVMFIWWLFEPARWNLAFPGGFLLPLLGFLLVPWTTLMYVLVSPHGIDGPDWFFLIMAFVADVLSYAGGGAAGRRRYTTVAY